MASGQGDYPRPLRKRVIYLDFLLFLTDVPPGRIFGMDQQTFVAILANLVNFCILALVLAFLLYRPVRNILRKRTERIQGQLAQAEDEMAKAAELKLEYEKKLADVGRERDEILSEARKLAADTSQRLVNEAKKEADAARTRAAANIEVEWERAESEMRVAIIEVSAQLAEKFVTLAINKETHDKLFSEAITDLGEMKWKG